MKQKQTPTRSNDVILHQFLKLIPRGMVGRIAEETGIDAKARSFGVMSHVTAMIPPAHPPESPCRPGTDGA